MTNGFSALFDLIGVLARRRHQMGEQRFAALGLNHTEARLLSLLSDQGGEAAQDALSSMLFIDRSNAGRALQALESAGYVTRDKDASDRRTKSVRMTVKGRQAATEIKKLRDELAQSFFGSLSDEQAGEIAALLASAIEPKGSAASGEEA